MEKNNAAELDNLLIKVLASAYACEPGKGSEPDIGWNWVQQISQFAEIWVITRANNRSAILRATSAKPVKNIHWVWYDLPSWASFWKKGPQGVHLYYYLWQIGAYRIGKRLNSQVKFDLVHHLTFGNYWMPSYLARLSAPFIWGPVGGGETTPTPFFSSSSLQGMIYEIARGLICRVGEHDPTSRIAAKKSVIALATTNETAERLKRLGSRNIRILSQVALSNEEIQKLSTTPMRSKMPFRFLSIGRLLHWKGFALGIEAFACFAQHFNHCEYWIIGEGVERNNLERLITRLGITDKVNLLGALPREEVFMKLADVDVLVHPSLHDSGGYVIAEAMAAGRPVICLDVGGPALQVTKKTGFKIPAQTHDQVIQDIAKAMLLLNEDTELRYRMSQAARQRVREQFVWKRKGDDMRVIYSEIIRSTLK